VKMRDDSRWVDVGEIMSRGAGAMIGNVYKEAGADPEQLERAQLWSEHLNRIDQIKDREFTSSW